MIGYKIHAKSCQGNRPKSAEFNTAAVHISRCKEQHSSTAIVSKSNTVDTCQVKRIQGHGERYSFPAKQDNKSCKSGFTVCCLSFVLFIHAGLEVDPVSICLDPSAASQTKRRIFSRRTKSLWLVCFKTRPHTFQVLPYRAPRHVAITWHGN
jgi:hypothetical protein